MKGNSPLKQIQPLLPCWRKLLFVLGVSVLPFIGYVQTTVTSVTYGSLVDTADTSHGGLTYQGTFAPVSSVATSVGNYQFTGPVASNIIVRRTTGEAGPNNATVFYPTSSSGSTTPHRRYENSATSSSRGDGCRLTGC